MSSSASRTVLVTGASTGIGEACAVELDRLGWRVFAGIRDPRAGERLAQRASARMVPVQLDVTDSDQIAAAARHIEEAVGPHGLDGLVNNAGVAVPGPLEALAIADVRRQLEINTVAPIAVTQAMLPMLRRASGRIVMMSSISGRLAPPYLGAYAMSKFALEAASDALRIELRRWRIHVSLVEPGSVVTPIWDKAKTTTMRLIDTLSPEMTELYGGEIRTFERLSDEFAAHGMPVSRVVAAVVHALAARRPKTRYPLGAQTRLSAAVFPFLPDRARDWIIRRQLGLR